MKIRKNKRLLICFMVTFLVSLAIVVWGIFFLSPGDELGYSILNLYIVFPLTSVITGLILGIGKTRLQWLYVIFVGILSFLMPLIVFRSFAILTVTFGVVAALVGISTGLVIHVLRSRNSDKHDSEKT